MFGCSCGFVAVYLFIFSRCCVGLTAAQSEQFSPAGVCCYVVVVVVGKLRTTCTVVGGQSGLL